MADEAGEGDGDTAAASGIASLREIKPAGDSIDGVDFISSLPDVILQHILSLIPTKFAIRTTVLSRRWRHAWSNTPSLYFDGVTPTLISQTLACYRAPKMTSFHIWNLNFGNALQIDSWIEFAISHKAEKLSLILNLDDCKTYKFSDSFYVNPCLKQLDLRLYYCEMRPRCSVFWRSLSSLSLTCCKFSDKSFPKILSGSPVLESLELNLCDIPRLLDLSKSLNLRSLVIDRCVWYNGTLEIVAPYLHCLRLRNSQIPCSLVDVSSLTEADLDIWFTGAEPLNANFLQDMVLKMLEKLQEVEKFTIGEVFLQILSLAEFRGVHFPTFKVKSLTLKSMIFIFQSVLPGISRLLQNSPGLKKLTLCPIYGRNIREKDLDNYLNSQGLNPHQCWRLKDVIFPTNDQTFPDVLGQNARPKLVSLFVNFVLGNTKSLETIIVHVERDFDETRFNELHQVASTLSRSNDVSIVILK